MYSKTRLDTYEFILWKWYEVLAKETSTASGEGLQPNPL